MRRISMAARDELVAAITGRYSQADRTERGRILDEFTAITGFHRKHAMRLLRAGQPSRRSGPRLGRRAYDDATRGALIVIWEASDRICGKRLRPLVPDLVEAMERHGHLQLAPEVRIGVLAMSAATIDRALKDGGRREIGGTTAVGYFRARSLTEGGYVAWVLRLVEIGAEGKGSCADVVEISRPDGLVDIADLGLTLAEAKLVLAGVQREIVAAQARDHAVRQPGCRRCEGVCRVKDYRQHAITMLFGQVAIRLPRFCCAGCGTTGTGVAWPPYACSTPELDRLRAQLSALLTYRTAAALLGQMFPVDAGQDPETLRRHTFQIAKTLSMTSAAEAPVSVDAQAIVVTLDSTFIRSCEDGERHLEVRIGNVETESGGRQVFGAVAKVNTDIGALIRRALDAVGRTGDTALTAFTDGCPGLRRILADAGVTAPPMLDWFHLAMRLQHLKQVAGVLSDEDPARGAAKAMIITEVER